MTDTSPLITLALADHSNVLTRRSLRVVIPDAVYVEATRVEGAPGASRLIAWLARHDDLVSIRPTETGLDQIERIRAGRSIRGLGAPAVSCDSSVQPGQVLSAPRLGSHAGPACRLR